MEMPPESPPAGLENARYRSTRHNHPSAFYAATRLPGSPSNATALVNGNAPVKSPTERKHAPAPPGLNGCMEGVIREKPNRHRKNDLIGEYLNHASSASARHCGA